MDSPLELYVSATINAVEGGAPGVRLGVGVRMICDVSRSDGPPCERVGGSTSMHAASDQLVLLCTVGR